MPVYIRTAAGRAAALNPLSPLPRSLRTLLTVIDGHSDSTIYIRRLPSLGDVQSLLDFLEKNGLIQVAYQRPTHPTEQPASDASSSEHSDEASVVVPWSDTHAGEVEPLSGASILSVSGALGALPEHVERDIPTATLDELSSIALAQKQPAPAAVPSVPAAIAANVVPNNNTAQSSQYKLRSAVLMISDFVTQHLPGKSIEIILLVESLETTEQLVSNLPGYFAVIEGLGHPAQAHIDQLNATLA